MFGMGGSNDINGMRNGILGMGGTSPFGPPGGGYVDQFGPGGGMNIFAGIQNMNTATRRGQSPGPGQSFGMMGAKRGMGMMGMM